VSQSQPYTQAENSSLMTSIAERTDKIINYSGYVNTSSEELIKEVEQNDSAESLDKSFTNDDGGPVITLPAMPTHSSNVHSQDTVTRGKLDKENFRKRCRFVSGDEKFIQE
jgi:hypothetical protein